MLIEELKVFLELFSVAWGIAFDSVHGDPLLAATKKPPGIDVWSHAGYIWQ
jgi:hypothetical protein